MALRRACVPSVLLLLSQLSRTEALLTGIAAPRRQGAVSVQANLLTTGRLLFTDLVLKAQMQLDPELELYSMPQRDLVRSDEDIKILVENFPEKTRVQFLDWYEGYKLEVMAPKPAGPGLSEDEVVTVFNRILERLILLSEKKYRFESRHEGIVAPYDYFEFGQEYVERRVESNLSSLAAQAASWQPTHTPRTDPPGCGLLHALERREPARHRSPRDLHEGGGATPAQAET